MQNEGSDHAQIQIRKIQVKTIGGQREGTILALGQYERIWVEYEIPQMLSIEVMRCLRKLSGHPVYSNRSLHNFEAPWHCQNASKPLKVSQHAN